MRKNNTTLNDLISISSISSVSALGSKSSEVWESYKESKPLFQKENDVWVTKVSSEIEREILQLEASKTAYKKLDRSVLLAILAAKKAMVHQTNSHQNFGVNIGSSRGATTLFERFYDEFLCNDKVSPFASPTTTLGNISSWVGQELRVQGIRIDHSVTCSTAMHALLNGIAWLQAGMADVFLVGGSEAALTPFTLAQMQALKLYSNSEQLHACESLKFPKKKNTMVLGEGAAVAVLEKGKNDRTLAVIKGYGFASETLTHNSSISENATCFQDSMRRALERAKLDNVDVIVMHAPGTVKGDLAEKNAIDAVFGNEIPLLTSNKWILGHTFGASGMMSIELAIGMLQHQEFIENPFYINSKDTSKPIKNIMINAVGFVGNAVSVILSN